MPLENLVAAAGLGAIILYGVLGGADFGGGIWDLFAAGPRRDEQRAAIAHAMGPVYLIYPDMTLKDAAAPPATLRFVLYALAIGLGLLVPSLWLLFRVFKRTQL